MLVISPTPKVYNLFLTRKASNSTTSCTFYFFKVREWEIKILGQYLLNMLLINYQSESAQAEQKDCCHALQNALPRSSASN